MHGLAALMRSIPVRNTSTGSRLLRHPDMRIVGLRTKKASPQSSLHQPPRMPVPKPGRKRKEQMKLNKLAKTVVLGLAVLLASSAFASNKGTLQVREAFVVNGQQLSPGQYQLRWEGTGSNVEVSFMQGKKEVAKVSAKVVSLDKAPDFDSAILDRASGKATISEVRFAGKKYALDLGDAEKAEMKK